MNLIAKLVCSPWFWLDIVLSVSGGVVVWWGLMIEKRAEKFAIPSDFKPDIFGDFIDEQKRELERGWRILMAGIAIEVIAAFGISIMSGLEIADLTEKSAAANLEAKQAEKDSSEARRQAEGANERASSNELQVAILNSNNLMLEIELQKQVRKITKKQENDFIALLKNVPNKIPVKIFCNCEDDETTRFAAQIREILDRSGFGTGTNPGIVKHDPNYIPCPIGGVSIEDYPFGIVFYGDINQTLDWPGLIIKFYPTNNSTYVDWDANSKYGIAGVLYAAFVKVGIWPGIAATTNWFHLKPNEWGIEVNQKF